MSHVVEGIVPPGGWHFKDPSGYRVPATGEAVGFLDLVSMVQKHRLENRLEIGNPEADVEGYLCTTFPHLCGIHHMPRGAYVVNNAAQERFVDVILAWANTLLDYIHQGKVERVPESEANRRGEICRACPFNVVWEDQCGPCTATAQRALATIRSGLDVSHFQRMHYCRHHRFDARTAVWLGRAHFGASAAPDNCWLRK